MAIKVKHGILATVILALVLAVGFVIGFFSAPTKTNTTPTITTTINPVNSYYESLIQSEDNSFNEVVIESIDAQKIENHLRNMSSVSHMGGTPGDLVSANYVFDTWISQKLDYVKKIDYDVLLANPDPNRANSFEIIDRNGEKTVIEIIESAYDPELSTTYIPRPFLAYSISGSYNSDKVYYANYGTLEDFKYMKENGINLTDSVVICRYGKIFRGNKVKLAAQYGAKAVLIYEDPIRGAPSGQQVYPDGVFLPKDGMQRGSLFTGNGDPLTPIYPSTKYANKIDQNESPELPTIVAQVIGYDHAKTIFELMQGEEVDDPEWKGGMNVKYTFGGPLKDNQKLGVNVYNERKIAKTYNVIGIIKGLTEPDRYVLMGNHRDAWVLGAIDPTSGTASMLEISRVLSEMKLNKGWKPKRSIIFCSWGAEEFGLIGSTEWVEEFQKKVSANGVAYLNIDIAVQGNFSYVAKSTPLLFDLIYAVTKTVKLTDEETVYQRWLEYAPNADKTKPLISSSLGSGSDYMGFQQRIGLACVDSTFSQNTKLPQFNLLGSSYPTYHSSFETFNLVKSFVDPGFKSFKAVATVVAELARRLSDSLILPFNCNNYATDMKSMLADLKKTYGNELNAQGISLNGLEEVINNYEKASLKFHERLDKIDKTHVNVIRQYNDQMKNLEKSFIDPIGISRNGFQHMLSAPSLYNSYAGSGFPALSDSIFNAIGNYKDPSLWNEVKKQLSIVIYVINSASSVLDEPVSFEREF